MTLILPIVPGLILAVCLAYMQRTSELRGYADNQRQFSVEYVQLILLCSVFFTASSIYGLLYAYITLDQLGTAIFASIVVLKFADKPAYLLIKRFVKNATP